MRSEEPEEAEDADESEEIEEEVLLPEPLLKSCELLEDPVPDIGFDKGST